MLGGDIITKVDGDKVYGADQLRTLIASHKVGEHGHADDRARQRHEKLSVTLGKAPAEATTPANP